MLYVYHIKMYLVRILFVINNCLIKIFVIMKKKYVSLKMQVVEVQLSDCIAGSSNFTVTEGTTDITEINNMNGSISFDTW